MLLKPLGTAANNAISTAATTTQQKAATTRWKRDPGRPSGFAMSEAEHWSREDHVDKVWGGGITNVSGEAGKVRTYPPFSEVDEFPMQR
ncbi:hypothetical protein Y032_0192g1339 [Ancylostoma ceylanicum]|uniref:Uncharacterized protein n=1 Tax=Ancylostoma ceylanicum TaxID=53326 RepID=A0A016SQD8_9BILA|nr:hypothetical protein Y032_0192g1339 [Ancylostoma ceylanicum]